MGRKEEEKESAFFGKKLNSVRLKYLFVLKARKKKWRRKKISKLFKAPSSDFDPSFEFFLFW